MTNKGAALREERALNNAIGLAEYVSNEDWTFQLWIRSRRPFEGSRIADFRRILNRSNVTCIVAPDRTRIRAAFDHKFSDALGALAFLFRAQDPSIRESCVPPFDNAGKLVSAHYLRRVTKGVCRLDASDAGIVCAEEVRRPVSAFTNQVLSSMHSYIRSSDPTGRRASVVMLPATTLNFNQERRTGNYTPATYSISDQLLGGQLSTISDAERLGLLARQRRYGTAPTLVWPGLRVLYRLQSGRTEESALFSNLGRITFDSFMKVSARDLEVYFVPPVRSHGFSVGACSVADRCFMTVRGRSLMPTELLEFGRTARIEEFS